MTSALGTLAGAAAGGAIAAAATSGLANQVGNAVNSVLNNVPRLPATIICINPACIGVVPFDFNPDQITINRTASVSTKSNLSGSSTPPGATPAIVRKVNAPTIALNDRRLPARAPWTRGCCPRSPSRGGRPSSASCTT